MTTKAQQDLAFIREIMDESRSFATVGGNHFIVWGGVLSVALFATWLRTRGVALVSPAVVWLVCVATGWLLTAYVIRRQRAVALAVHPSASQIRSAWVALGIAMTLTFFLGTMSGSIALAAIPGLSAAFTGVGIHTNGMLARIGWLKNLAYAWWACGAAMLYWPGNYNYALLAVLMLALYVVPGFLLNGMAARAMAARAAA